MKAKRLAIVIMLLCLGLLGCTTNGGKDVTERNNKIEEPKTDDGSNSEKEKTENKADQNEIETSEDTKESFTIDIGDGKHSFKVVMEAKPFEDGEEGEFFDSALNISIYDINDLSSPVQVIEDKTLDSLFKDYEIVDANFDGYKDFCYVHIRGNANYYCRFWIWDPKSGKFMESPDLSEISMPQFDNDLKVVKGYWRSSAAANETRYYKYIDGKLTCVRYLEMGNPDGEGMQTLIVEDYVEGKLVEVFREKALLTEEYEGEVYDRFFKWLDLNYHGE
ncbi:XAC2610-related protein [Acetivibrio straminisolvens]|jgi:hypothetical protein|uniref:Lipoprotein n=1 Tax=Acetivibrio straminisolvens JCM 21531 TaxID=1294263 RepID=W4VB61_9FIRM|nr:hypothetical protein [Acetivibrio straminisolvens]GAE89979.1 hypothetical protein JCM21531_3554 [Acetivibrio straminisolvens JCM 21531]